MLRRYTIVSLFDEDFFSSVLERGMLKRAQEKGLIEIDFVNIRDFSEDKHQRIDDQTFRGRAGHGFEG